MPNWVQCRVIFKDKEVLKKYLTEDENGIKLDFQKIIPMPEDLNKSIGVYTYHNPNSQFQDIYGNVEKEAHLTELLDKLYEEVEGDKQTLEDFEFLAIHNKEIVDELFKVYITDDKERSEVKLEYTIKDTNDEFFKDFNIGLGNVTRGYYNCRHYGDESWWHWRIRNWGTKWNTDSSNTWYEEDYNSIDFQTAYNMPEGVIKKIAEETPVRILFADEDTYSRNCGIHEYYYDEEYGEVLTNYLLTPNDVDDKYVRVLSHAIWGYDMEELLEEEVEEGEEPDYTEEDKDTINSIEDKVDDYLNEENWYYN